MSQFGGSKNPPWSSLGTANAGGHHQVMQSSLMGLGPSAAGLYNQQMAASASSNTLAMQAQMQASAMQAQAALQPQAQMMPMQQMAAVGASQNSQLNVSYPSSGGRQTQGNQPKQRVFMGTVTKLHDTFGFIDEDVFFQTSTVKGSMPKVGEKVLVEATFNPNMPFKWNATRVQHLNQATSSSLTAQQMAGGGMNPMAQQTGMMNPGPMMNMGMHNPQQGLLGNPPQAALNMSNRRNENERRRLDRNREREERERERMREQQERDNRDRKREQREREYRDQERKKEEREKERDRSPVKKRSRSPRRSPKRQRKPIPRYVVQVPRFPLDIKSANVLELKKRYSNLYIPSDYFLSDCCYQDAFPLGKPFNTSHPCSFHVMAKDTESLVKNSAVLEPPDISYQYSAKVMLLASVSEDDFFRECCGRIEDPSEVRENFQHPARILNFLVGSRGKNDLMAIGGPWSPSLDGADPANDKSVLIRTAIRTTKALTGIDLSGCGQWYRFLEIRYHRGEQKGRVKPRVETVVMFVPDVWNLMPTMAEWETLSASYKDIFTAKFINPPATPDKDSDGPDTKQQDEDEKDASMEDGSGEDQDSKEKVCTPWRELDPKTMKVQGLRDELDGRGLNSKGLKTQLVARLTKALKKEEEDELAEQKEKDEAAAEEEKMEAEDQESKEEGDESKTEEEEKEEEPEIDPKELEEKKRKEEKERQLQEKKYTLPETPSVVVHPSATAKGGKFECTTTNLSVLLDYRPEDTKEHSFEVSLFAELFNELLQRDFAFNIYQAIQRAPERKEEKKEKKKEDKKDDKKDTKKDDKKEDKKEDKKDGNKDEKTKKDEEKKEGDKKEEKKKEPEAEEDEPKEKKRKVEEDAADEQTKVEETKEEGKDKKEEGKEKKTTDSPAAEEGKKDDKKKDDKASKTANKNRSSSQENVPKPKLETLDPMLLLSCVYFDQNHCGYILEKDLEDLLNCLGLNLSRAQLRKLLHKVITRDSWAYRKITDGVKDETVKEGINGTTSVEPYRGNLSLMESLHKTPSKPKVEGDGLVTYEGAVVDLASTMSRVKKSEQQRRLAEAKIGQLQKESDKWKNLASNSQESLKAINLDVENLKRKLLETEEALRTSRRKNEEFKVCVDKAQKSMEEMSGRFKVILEKDERKEKKGSPDDKKPVADKKPLPAVEMKKEVKT